MSLSDSERKALEELERSLYESDSSFAARMGGSQQKLAAGRANSSKRIVAGAALVLVGITEVLAALIMKYPMFGILGFGIMVFGLSLATGQFGRQHRVAKSGPKPKRAARQPKTAAGEGNLFERRWDARNPD